NTNEPGEKGLVNQIAGIDVALTLPFRFQPVQAYLEMAGEDEAHLLGTPIPFPTKFAYVAGVFLPSLFGNAKYDLRAEWARNHWRGNGPAWYIHGTSDGGYAHFYRGRVLGHPMGTDAQDLSVQGHYFFLPSTYLEVTLARTDRSFTGDRPKERTDRASAGLVGWLYENVRVEGELARERVKDAGGLPGASGADTSFRVAFSYQLGTGK
ncbi:MAG: capsule assembly Wzi family protein, partial [Candidatus Deferrimicrobiaceae bacterium]